MSDEVRLSVIWGTVIVLVFATFVGGLTYYNVTTTRSAMENGYEETSIPGESGVYWRKVGECKAEK